MSVMNKEDAARARKERSALTHKAWYRKNKEKIARQHKEWRLRNPEKRKQKDKEWAERNHEKVREAGRRYFKSHRELCAERSKRWRAKNPEKVKQANHRNGVKRYGLTVEQYAQMLIAQNGGCAICGKAEKRGSRLHVDHVHATGKVRGLLCTNHNVAIGMLQDDTVMIARLIKYIRKHE